ncbi:ABC transporter ATP-binding protein [Mucilaginibacter rigui]|uniref:ABC transporter ATP-binding protein n=1 Tax=Mucilaginibacter rigui TaxID=534635 RepID=A0ABR7X7P2_9SPHI|nr:ABC transporter ATP-binding protein [Mucilaginibacter rigui]MBD1386584.1 ABC transporter ATP-binding protein [Mucilaginibacter rigui]
MKTVTIEHIVKTYPAEHGTVEALKGISFEIDQGEVFGLIGPDGAGKTSLFRILTTLLLANSGNATVNGFDVVKDYKSIRNCIGYMPGKFSLYQDLSVQENLEFFATIFNTSIRQNYGLIKEIYEQIEPFKTRKAGQLSGGMKQKLALCCALIHKPTVLFLDEPTTGVDAVSRREFWEMLHRLKVQGITILVSTPYMDEASLCDRVALIQKGGLLSVNTPKGIISEFKKTLWSVSADDMFGFMKAIKKDPGVESCYPFGQVHHVVFKTEENSEAWLQQIAVQNNYNKAAIKVIEPNIEDCFMALMQD